MKDSPLAKLAGTGRRVNFDKDPEAAKKIDRGVEAALKGKTVGVQGSTVNSQFLEKYLKDTIQIREYKTTEQHDLDLAAGRIDAIFAGHALSEGHAREARVQGHGDRRRRHVAATCSAAASPSACARTMPS